jgi:general secretion pathway protein G
LEGHLVLKHLTSSNTTERRGAQGFTLIELLVVVIILGILAAVAIFSVGNLTDNAEENTCKTELATVKTAVQAYQANSDSGTDLPNSTSALLEDNGGNLESTPKFFQVGAGGVISELPGSDAPADCLAEI